jgi:hypothetical protein
MGKASNVKRKRREDDPADHIPDTCFRCSRCGRPWIKAQARWIKGDTLCFPCAEEFDMAVAKALYEAQEAEWLMQMERAKHARLN